LIDLRLHQLPQALLPAEVAAFERDQVRHAGLLNALRAAQTALSATVTVSIRDAR
jgi:hypothetical protein